jgi:hypothetical protein
MATNSYRMTITIPVSVKEHMDQVKEQVNWSAVAAEAFQRKVVEIRTRRTKAMTKAAIISRLKAAGEADPKGFEAGRAFGRKWGEEKAPPRYLRNLARNPEEAFEWKVDPDPAPYEGGPYRTISYTLARVITDESGGENAQAFWAETVGADGYELADKEDFARGFVAGALEVWEEVKDELEL